MNQNYYRILGVASNASQAEITAAWKRLVRKFHPDLNPDSASAAQKLQLVNKAHEVLSNPELRQVYDDNLREHLEQKSKQRVAKSPPVDGRPPVIKTESNPPSLRQFQSRQDNSKLIAFLIVLGIASVIGIAAVIGLNKPQPELADNDSRTKTSPSSKGSDAVNKKNPSTTSGKQKLNKPDPKAKPKNRRPADRAELVQVLTDSIDSEILAYFDTYPDAKTDQVQSFVGRRLISILRNAAPDISVQKEQNVLNDVLGLIRPRVTELRPKPRNDSMDDRSGGGRKKTLFSPFDRKDEDKERNVVSPSIAKDLITVPDESAIEQAKTNLTSLFEDSIERIESLPENETRFSEYKILANKLIDEVDLAEKSDAEKYACFWLASDLARLSHDMDFALNVLKLFESRFEVDLDTWRFDFFKHWKTEVDKSYESLITRSAARQKIAMYAFQVGSGIYKRGNKDVAEKLFRLGIDLFERNNAQDLSVFARDLLKDLFGQRDAQIKKIEEDLKSNPNQADKTLLLGKLLCLERLDWRKGLPILAKSTSASLKKAARMELAADDAEKTELTADYWWDLASNTSDHKHSAAMRIRAAELYKKLLKEVSSLKRQKFESRIQSVGRIGGLSDLYRVSCKWNDGLLAKDIVHSADNGMNRFGAPYSRAMSDFQGVNVRDLNLRKSSSFTMVFWMKGKEPSWKLKFDDENVYFRGTFDRNVWKSYVELHQDISNFYRRYSLIYDRGKMSIVVNGKAWFDMKTNITPTSAQLLTISNGLALDEGNFSPLRIYSRALTVKEIRRLYIYENLPESCYSLLDDESK